MLKLAVRKKKPPGCASLKYNTTQLTIIFLKNEFYLIV
jgi:hypothetical protein